MLEYAKKPYMDMVHPSNDACLVANELSNEKVLCVTRDIVATDQLIPVARFSGYLKIQRISQLHTLNLTAALEEEAEVLNKPFNEMRAIGVQVGGGVGMAGLKNGRYEDIVNAGGEGAMSPERSGGMNIHSFGMFLIEDGLGKKEVSEIVMKSGGLQSYLLTQDVKKVYSIISDKDVARNHFKENEGFFKGIFKEKGGQRIEDDYVRKLQAFAKLSMNSMQYQIAKEVGGLHYSLFESEPLDAIVITGGIAQSEDFRNGLRRILSKSGNRISFRPGQREMQALRDGAERALKDEKLIQSYTDNMVNGWEEMLESL